MSIIVDHKLLKHALRGLKDVQIAGLAGGDILMYDDFLKKWCNSPFPINVLDDLEDVEVANPTDMDMIIFAGIGNKWVKQPCTLDRHKDVEISSPANDQVLTYDGLAALWKNKAPPGVYTGAKGMMNALTQVVQSGVWTTVNLDTELFDDNVDVSFDPVNHTFSILQTGRYLISCGMMLQNLVDQDLINVSFERYTPAPIKGLLTPIIRPSGNGWFNVNEATVVALTAGWGLRLVCYHTMGSNRTIAGGNENYTYASITRVK